MLDQFLTLKEVAEILKVTPVHVQNLIHSGKLRGYKFGCGRAMRVQVTDLNDYIGGSQVIDNVKMKRGTEFHVKCLQKMHDTKNYDFEAIAEGFRDQDPEGYAAFQYSQKHKNDRAYSPAISQLRFDTPNYSTAAAAGCNAGSSGGGDYEQAVEQIMTQDGCSEGQAVKKLMETEQGQKLFKTYWEGVEKAAQERRR